MAYRHITRCVPLGQQKDKTEVILSYGVPAGIIGAALGWLALGWVAGGAAGAAAGLGAAIPLALVLGFCDWWFHYRLICIEDDQCAVGTVGLTEVSTGIDDPDLDFTINLVLAPINKASLLDAAAQIPLLPPNQQRYLVPQKDYPKLDGVNEKSTVAEPGLVAGIFASKDKGTTALHCEIEGNGMQTVCTVATVAAVVALAPGAVAGAAAGAAALAGCLALGIFAWLCAIVVAIAALAAAALAAGIITGLGWVIGVGLGGDKGSPADVAAEPGSGTVSVGDHVAIIGDWIFDTAHTGWHELHPVKKLLRIPCPSGTSVPGVDVEEPHSKRSEDAIEAYCLSLLTSNIDRICYLLAQGRADDVVKAQRDPSTQYVVNPYVG